MAGVVLVMLGYFDHLVSKFEFRLSHMLVEFYDSTGKLGSGFRDYIHSGETTMGDARRKIAVAGSGYFSQFHYDAWRRLNVDVAGICSLDVPSATTIAADFDNPPIFEDFTEMLDNVQPELVDIATPPPTHLAFIKAAAERGIDIICQKPFTLSLAEASEAVTIAEEADVMLVVHENFRFQPWFREIHKLLAADIIGTPYQVSFRLRPGDGQGPDAYLGRQPYFQKMERFLVHETAIHLIDVFRYLFGEVENVTAELSQLNPVIAGEDAATILFRFANGTRGLFDGNRLSDHIAENRRLTMGEMMVEGQKGTLRLNGDGGLFFRAHGDNEETAIDYHWENKGFGGDCVFALQAHVLEYMNKRGSLMNTAREYLANLRIEEAIYRSDEMSARVKLGGK